MKNSENKSTLGERIRNLRHKHQLSQDDLAEAINISRVSISHWEQNKNTPKGIYAVILAKVLQCDLEWLLSGEGSPHRDRKNELSKMINERIRKKREALKLPKTSIAKELGVTTSAVNGWESGKIKPKGDNLYALAKILKCNAHWLSTGEGSSKPITSKKNSQHKEWFLTSELIMVDGFPNSTMGISQKARKQKWKSRQAHCIGNFLEYHISNFTDDVIAQLEDISHRNDRIIPIQQNIIINGFELCQIPVYNIYEAGHFSPLNDTKYQTYVELLPKEWLQHFGLEKSHSRIVICHDDSMEKTLNNNDSILVDIREQAYPIKTGVYIINLQNKVLIRRLKYDAKTKSCEIISDNAEKYPPVVLAGAQLDDFKICGKVITAIMKEIV